LREPSYLSVTHFKRGKSIPLNKIKGKINYIKKKKRGPSLPSLIEWVNYLAPSIPEYLSWVVKKKNDE